MIAEIIPEVVRAFPWPKSMRWGARALTWVRPLHSILCTFGPETEEPEIVKFEIDGIKAGDITHGHRVHAPGPIKVKRLEDYLTKLHAAKVVPDPDRRKADILADAKDLALAQGLELVEDEGLLEEVAGLVEWPVVLIGSFDAAFLGIPPEVIRATIRNNQKCFVLRDPKTGKLANKFITVANQEATDGGEAIKAGNARVIRARLADAKFFWEQDRKKKLEERLPKLKEIVFHEKLGTQAERVERIARTGEGTRAHRQGRSKKSRAGGAARQGRSRHRHGRRIPRAAGADGEILRARRRHRSRSRSRDRGTLQAAGAERPGTDLPCFHRGRAGGQDRHARRLLGHRREADGVEGPLCAAASGAWE